MKLTQLILKKKIPKTVKNDWFKYPQDHKNGASVVKESDHPFFNETKMIMYALQFIGWFPFTRNSSGAIVYSFFSYAELYWMAVFGIQMYGIREVLETIREDGGQLRFEVAMRNIRNGCVLLNLLLVPFGHIFEWRRFTVFINDMDSFMVICKKLTGLSLKINLTPLSYFAIVGVPAIALVSTYADVNSFGINHYYERLIYVGTFSGMVWYSYLWVMTHIVLKRLARFLETRLYEVALKSKCHTKMSAQEVCRLRLLWAKGATLLIGTGDCFSLTMITLIMTNTICTTLAALGFISAASEENKQEIYHHILNSLSGIAFILTSCEAAYQSTHYMNDNIIRAVGAIDISAVDDAVSREVVLFLQVISIHQPIVKCGGFIVVSRTYLTSVMSNLFTYLILTVQLRSHDLELARKNETLSAHLANTGEG